MTPTQILHPQLRELLAHGAQLVEVLPPREYDALHLPQAMSIPLSKLDADVLQPEPATTRPHTPRDRLLARLEQATARQRCSPTPTAACSRSDGEAICKPR